MSTEYLEEILGTSHHNFYFSLLLDIVSSKVGDIVINTSGYGNREIPVTLGLKKACTKYINK